MIETKVKVVEALCGCGKTTWAASHMNANPDKKWLFVTPFLSEAGDGNTDNKGRIGEACPSLNFKAPKHTKEMNKTEHLEKLICSGENVSITHNLFLKINGSILECIEANNYCLMIDESVEKVEMLNTTLDRVEDIQGLIKTGTIEVDQKGKLTWVGIKLNAYSVEYDLCQSGLLYLFNDRLLLKNYSSQVYELSSEVYVLTYMFKHSPMRCWFDANNISWGYHNPQLMKSSEEKKLELRNLIRIEKDDESLSPFHRPLMSEFSSSWFKSATKDELKVLKKVGDRLYMRWRKRDGSPPNIMYTVFKTYAQEVAGKGTREVDFLEPESNFVSKNARATNQHRERSHLIYWPNTYIHVSIKEYLDSLVPEQQRLSHDGYALSELIQWVFRSRVRSDEPITIFIASRRMKKLFTEWLYE